MRKVSMARLARLRERQRERTSPWYEYIVTSRPCDRFAVWGMPGASKHQIAWAVGIFTRLVLDGVPPPRDGKVMMVNPDVAFTLMPARPNPGAYTLNDPPHAPWRERRAFSWKR